VVNGHLHFDNIGGKGLFPGVPIFVQQTEWDVAHAGGATYRADRVDFDVLDWIDFPGANYRRVDGEHEVVSGIRLFPTPGHTPGHQAVLIETDQGLAVVAGQLPYDHVEWEWIRTEHSMLHGATGDPLQNVVVGDPETYLASAIRLVELDPRHVHFTHDPIAWRQRDEPPLAPIWDGVRARSDRSVVSADSHDLIARAGSARALSPRRLRLTRQRNVPHR